MGKQLVSAAPGGAGIQYEDFIGKLFVVEPLELEKDVKTEYGAKDAVRANVYVLLGPNRSEDFEDTLIFPMVLQSQTRRQIGSIVVGRLAQGDAKPKQKPPWVFQEATESDLKKAANFLASRQVKSAEADDDGYGEDEGEDAF